MRFLLILPLLCGPSLMAGDILSYVDSNGVKVFTNAPSRKNMRPPSDVTSKLHRTVRKRSETYRPAIEKYSTQYGVDPDLVQAIMAVESNFDHKAVSVKDCKGLMQLHPDTAKRFGVKDVFDPDQNIHGGVRYLQFLLDQFDSDLTRVVAAYNAGENAVVKYDGIPPYRETKDYVKKVGRLYDLTQEPIIGEVLRPERNNTTRRVHRIALPDGKVVFTNTPSAYTGQ